MSENNTENEIKSWLKVALVKEELDDISIDITGSTEKGSGYVGQMVFVTKKKRNGALNKYDLLLKCSSSSKVFVEKNPELFDGCVNESYIYDKVFPTFTQFQIERGIDKPFDSFAKCYGVFNSDTRSVTVLQNLNKLGYHLWDSKKPLPSQHINLVIENYAKFHAVSVAMMEQEPQKLQILASELKDIVTAYLKNTKYVDVMEETVEDIYNLLKNNVDRDVLQKWIHLKNHVRSFLLEEVPNVDGLRVIVHGDSWNNNFMYKYNDEEKTSVSKVAILDWQVSQYTSPVLDLSYFLFSCSPSEVFENMNVVLKNYYDSLMSHLQKLGSSFSTKYKLESFLNEWKKYGKYGLIMCLMPLKVAFVKKEEIPDLTASVEKGGDVTEAFQFKIIDEESYKSRLIPVVKYAVESGMI